MILIRSDTQMMKKEYLSNFDFYGAIRINKNNMHETFYNKYTYISFDIFGKNVVIPYDYEMIPRINYMNFLILLW